MFIDINFAQIKKYGQNVNGDFFLSKKDNELGRLIAVLADGLGSGVKANILSCMTAKMLLRFIEEDIQIKKAAEIIMNALPICRIRKIGYSTFSAVDCDENGNTKIVEEGNPEFVWLRNNEVMTPEYITIESNKFINRKLKIYSFKLEIGDRLILCSDGVTQAGLGNEKYKLGLRRDGLIEILHNILQNNNNIASFNLATYVVDKALQVEEDNRAKDDISACVIYCRQPRESLIFTGPPYHQEKDNEYAILFNKFNGKKAICGGTTASLVARELKKTITTAKTCVGNLPPCSFIEGVDLVTEGILTLTKTAEYLENSTFYKDNSATKLADFFLESDIINFMVGAKLNQAHYDPSLPIEIEIRKNVIKRLATILQNKYYKKVNIQYI